VETGYNFTIMKSISRKTKKRSAIDLFSGAGGLTQGLKQAGFDVIGAVESHSTYAETFRLNHPSTNLIEDEITKVDPSIYMEKLGLKEGELDLLAGCPPCQGYSTIGTRNRGQKNDPRNELVFEILRFVLAFKPKTIMMENVPALANDERLRALQGQLEKAGYQIDVKVLNMTHYDVPQMRRRMIMLGSRTGRVEIISKELDARKMKTVRDVISNLPKSSTSDDSLHNIPDKRSEKITKLISLVPKNGGSRTDLPDEFQLECHKRTTGFKDVYGRMAWDKPAPTITGGCSNPSKGRFLHPEEDRPIS
jgi:DNA (cytosine-5)-methyltransferase 1